MVTPRQRIALSRLLQLDLSRWRDLNPRPLPYQGSALPLSYIGKNWSGRRGSNSRPSAWKADALSTELLPHFCVEYFVGEDGFEPPKVKTSRFTVCPIWPLWYSPKISISFFTALKPEFSVKSSLLSDSNQRPRDYKSRALAN